MTTNSAAKPTAKAATAKASPKAPVKPAPKAPAAKASPVAVKEAVRTSHSDCTHAKTGAEGKKARAACHREKAQVAKAASA